MEMKKVMVGALALMVSVAACKKDEAKQEPAAQAPAQVEPAKVEPVKSPLEQAREAAGAFAALPADFKKPGQTPEQEKLGRQLYYETRLSKNFDISCNSCHMLDSFGVDNKPTSPVTRASSATATRPRSTTPRVTACSSGMAARRMWRRRPRGRS